MIVLQTERLRVRHMQPGDAGFMLGLLKSGARCRCSPWTSTDRRLTHLAFQA
jgi:hypothetical protein